MNANPTLSFNPTSSFHSHSIHHHHHQHQFKIDKVEEKDEEMKCNVKVDSNHRIDDYYDFDYMISQVIESNLNQHLQSADLKLIQTHSTIHNPITITNPNWLLGKNLENLNLNHSTSITTTTNSNSKQSINLLTINNGDHQIINSKASLHRIPKFYRASSEAGHLNHIKSTQSVCSDREIKFHSVSTPLHPQNDSRSQLTQWREEAFEYLKKKEQIQAWINDLPVSFEVEDTQQILDWEAERIGKDDDRLIELVAYDLQGLKICNSSHT